MVRHSSLQGHGKRSGSEAHKRFRLVKFPSEYGSDPDSSTLNIRLLEGRRAEHEREGGGRGGGASHPWQEQTATLISMTLSMCPDFEGNRSGHISGPIAYWLDGHGQADKSPRMHLKHAHRHRHNDEVSAQAGG